jgi:hypothetical protein
MLPEQQLKKIVAKKLCAQHLSSVQSGGASTDQMSHLSDSSSLYQIIRAT